MDFLLAGTLVSFARGVQCRVIVQRSLTPAAFRLWKTFRSKPNAIPGRTKSVRLPTGTVFAFRPECCSESQRNGVRLQPGIAFAFDRIPHVINAPKSVPPQGEGCEARLDQYRND
jgi:hypothetical protein